MVDPDSDGVPRAPPYSGTASWRPHCFAYGTVTLFGRAVRLVLLHYGFVTPRVIPMRPYNPVFLRFGLLPFRSPLLRESLLISLPVLLRWFTSHSLAPPCYLLRMRGPYLSVWGLPHSDIPVSKDVCSSSGLFAAYRVLLRLLAPQASTINLSFTWPYCLSPERPPLGVLLLPSLVMSKNFMGQIRVELMTPALSERCSNQLSYCPIFASETRCKGKERT